MISIGEMHPDLKKILRRDDFLRRGNSQLPGLQAPEAKHETAGSRSKAQDCRVQKQTPRPRFHFRNQTQLHSEASVNHDHK